MKQNTIQIPEGYKNSSLGIIPNDWEVKRLGEVCSTFKSGISITSKSINKQGLYPVYGGNGLRGYTDSFTHDGEYVLIGRQGALCGNITYCIGKQYISEHAIAVQVDNNHNDLKFFNYKLLFWNLNRFSESSAQPGLSVEKLVRYKLVLPPLPQQQKIAEILGAWDEAIEKQSKLIDKLTDRKRGLMQQLLTGKKRLAGFSEEWKEVRLGEIGETFTGLTGKTKDNFGTGDPFITYMNVYNSYQINTTQMDYVCLEKGESQNLVKYGDIFFTISSETPHEVGMSSVLLDEIENTYLNSFCFGYRLYNFTTLIPEFAKYYLRSKGIRLEMYKLAQGSTRFNLSKSEVLKIKVILPPLPEQTAISNILTAADKEIELAKSKLELLRSQKSGLMQELLTGKTRVNID